jgi:two-component sensor histidine kinase
MWNVLTKSLAGRIVFLMTLAMLPLGLISIYQTRVVLDDVQHISRASLMSETEAAATGERELIHQALGAAQGLAAAVPTLDEAGCTAIMKSFIKSQGIYIFAGYTDADGITRCNSAEQVRDLSQTTSVQKVLQTGEPLLEVNRKGTITGQSVVLANHPVYRNGSLAGLVTISIPHSIANALLEGDVYGNGLKLASVNLSGEIVAASGGLDEAPSFLPAEMDLDDLSFWVGQSFRGVAGDGTERFFAVAPMVGDRLILVGSWPVSVAVAGNSPFRARLALVFPVLMWITGIGVAFFGLQRLVVRHIRQLRSAMRKFALGDRLNTMLELDDPPQEIEEAKRAFNRMALIVSEAEIRQSKDLQDKEVLLREVHHRVKNNLQLIASIMNMQARSAQSSEAKRMLAGLQRRVRGLAMLHRTLYTQPDQTVIDANHLIKAVVEDVSNMSAEGAPEVKTDLISVDLYPDQAVPLSMLLTEALTNAFKYVRPDENGVEEILITLSESEGQDVNLTICNTLGDGPEAEDPEVGDMGDGLGTKLMTAFTRQIDGKVEQEREGNRFWLRITFPRRNFIGKGSVSDAA